MPREAGEVTLGLLKRDHRPAQMREQLPVARIALRKRGSGRGVVGVQKIFRAAHASRHAIGTREAPGARKKPSDVLEAMSPVREFPVEDGREPALVHEVVTRAKIVVQQADPRVLAQPRVAMAKAPLERGMRCSEGRAPMVEVIAASA